MCPQVCQQLSTNLESERVSVRCLHRLIESPRDGLSVGRGMQGRRRRLQKDLVSGISAIVHRTASRNHIDVGYARYVDSVVKAEGATRVLNRCAQPAWGVCVEGAEQLHSCAVIYFAEPSANNRAVTLAEKLSHPPALWTRRIGYGNARRDIRFPEVVPARPMVRRPAQLKSKQGHGVVTDTLLHV